MVVEVFKTNVSDADDAKILVDHIQTTFRGYRANFDLQDCDKILRVESQNGDIHITQLVKLLKSLGFNAEVLPDDIPEVLEF